MKFRTILLGLSALFVAACAAYFSVLGLSKLFAGSSMAVIIMGSSLEFAKLITAGFLYNYWKQINKILRIYLLIGTFVLITITSAGIYGFLTSAYQTTADQLSILDKQVELVELKKKRFTEQLNTYTVQQSQLNESIGELTKGLSNNTIQYKDKETGQIITTTSSTTRKVLTNQLNENKAQRDLNQSKMDVLNDSITALDIRSLNISSTNELAAEVGPLKYLAEITGREMNQIVNWFAIFIIFVFDPLAVTLIVAFNVALRVDRGERNKKKAEKLRTVYGEGITEPEIYEMIKSKDFSNIPPNEELIKANTKHAKMVNENQTVDNEIQNDIDQIIVELKKPKNSIDSQDTSVDESESNKDLQEKYLTDIMKYDQELGLYDNEDPDAKGLPPLYDYDDENEFGISNEFEPNIDINENDIEVIDEEIIIPIDTNNDGEISPEEARAHYERKGWKEPHGTNPYYHHPWFNWNKYPERWVTNPHAVDFWLKYRGGNHATLDSFRKSPYPTNFDSKIY